MQGNPQHPSELTAALQAAYPDSAPLPSSDAPPNQAPKVEGAAYLALATRARLTTMPYAGCAESMDAAASPQPLPLPLYTVEQFCRRNPAFTPSALRNLIFKAKVRYSSRGEIPGNGLIEAGALVRIGRKVLLHEPNFLAWAMAQESE